MLEVIVSTAILVTSLLGMLSILWSTIQTGISPMPSSTLAIHTAMTLMPDEHSGTLYDLGSGWGNAASHFAKNHPNIKVIGIEKSWLPYFYSKLLYRRDNLHFQRGDFYNITPIPNSVLYCYLYTGGMIQLSKHPPFQSCWVLSNTFACPNRTLAYESIAQDMHHSRIYLYTPEPEIS